MVTISSLVAVRQAQLEGKRTLLKRPMVVSLVVPPWRSQRPRNIRRDVGLALRRKTMWTCLVLIMRLLVVVLLLRAETLRRKRILLALINRWRKRSKVWIRRAVMIQKISGEEGRLEERV